jgi:hypothetical protein
MNAFTSHCTITDNASAVTVKFLHFCFLMKSGKEITRRRGGAEKAYGVNPEK